MSAALERLKQQSAQDGQQHLSVRLETLTSRHDAVEQQLVTLTRAVKDLTGHQKIMDEETQRQLQRLLDRSSTSMNSGDVSARIESLETEQQKISALLIDLVGVLDGRRLTGVTKALQQATTSLTTTATSVTEQVAQSDQLVKRAHGAAARIEKQASSVISDLAAASAASVAASAMEKISTAEARAEKVMARVDRIESRQLWTAAGAMSLALLPAATVVLGGIVITAGLVYGWEIAVVTEAATWLRVVRGVGALLGTLCALVGLAVAVRWVAGHISTWKNSPGAIRWRR